MGEERRGGSHGSRSGDFSKRMENRGCEHVDEAMSRMQTGAVRRCGQGLLGDSGGLVRPDD
jgi:hypothetical protein